MDYQCSENYPWDLVQVAILLGVLMGFHSSKQVPVGAWVGYHSSGGLDGLSLFRIGICGGLGRLSFFRGSWWVTTLQNRYLQGTGQVATLQNRHINTHKQVQGVLMDYQSSEIYLWGLGRLLFFLNMCACKFRRVFRLTWVYRPHTLRKPLNKNWSFSKRMEPISPSQSKHTVKFARTHVPGVLMGSQSSE